MPESPPKSGGLSETVDEAATHGVFHSDNSKALWFGSCLGLLCQALSFLLWLSEGGDRICLQGGASKKVFRITTVPYSSEQAL